MTDPGWFNAEGDPPGTQRYWDGNDWATDAVPNPHFNRPAGTHPGAAVPMTDIADAASRIGARFVDLLILIVVAFIFVLTGAGGSEPRSFFDSGGYSLYLGDDALDTSLEFFVLGIGAFLWATLWTHFAGGTPGKLMFQMKVADAATGAVPVSLPRAAIRSAMALPLAIVGFSIETLNQPMSWLQLFVGVISLIMLLAHGKHRTAMDFAAGTVVVSTLRSPDGRYQL